ncbi:hypothetical protein KKF34_18785 [Myxococcota bacterium]|nr:hypothetical protein [Myxococcota bacterium]MBU1380799.1 hypothetical protein [Myxococcota bacterium]MBU1498933.1 hypothetical protein [Myxococcota bacterium]
MKPRIEPVLLSLNSVNKKTGIKKISHLSTLPIIALIIASSTGAAWVTAILIYRQAVNRERNRQFNNIIMETLKDDPSSYARAIKALERPGVGSTGAYLRNKFILFQVFIHKKTEYIKFLDSRSHKKGRGKIFKQVYDIAHYLQSEKYPEAALECEKALASFPREPLFHFLNAIARIETYNYDAAYLSLKIVQELDKRYKIPYLFEMARLERRRAQYRKSTEFLNQVLKINKNHKAAILARKLNLVMDGQDHVLKKVESDPELKHLSDLVNGLGNLKKVNYLKAYNYCASSWDSVKDPLALECTIKAMLFGSIKPEKFEGYFQILKDTPTPDRQLIYAINLLRTGKPLEAFNILEKIERNSKDKKNIINRLLIKSAADLDKTEWIKQRCHAGISDERSICMWALWRTGNWQDLKKMLRKNSCNQSKGFFIDHERATIKHEKCKSDDILCLTVSFYSACQQWQWSKAELIISMIKDPVFEIERKIMEAYLYEKSGKFSKAFKSLDKLISMDIRSPVQLYQYAHVLLKMEQMDSVNLIAHQLRKQYPLTYYGSVLSSFYYSKRRNYTELKKSLDEAAVFQGRIQEMNILKSAVLLHRGEYPEMIRLLDESIRMTEDYPKYYYKAIEMLHKARQFKLVIDYANKIAEQASTKKDTSLYTYYLAKVFELCTEDEFKDFRRQIVEKIEKLPVKHPLAYALLSNYYRGIDDKNQKVREYLHKAVQLAPGEVILRLKLAELLKMTAPLEAEKHLRIILREFAYHSAALKARKLLRETNKMSKKD